MPYPSSPQGVALKCLRKRGGHRREVSNIQIVDINALNAALAVIRWKRLMGFNVGQQGEHQSRYTIDGNVIGNEDF
jgi:hypothetical protein